jgi:hypothetical protein
MDDIYPDDTYQEPTEEPYQDQSYYEPEPKKGMSGWLIALIVLLVLLLLCCICLCVATVLLGPAIGTTMSTIIETVEAVTPMP